MGIVRDGSSPGLLVHEVAQKCRCWTTGAEPLTQYPQRSQLTRDSEGGGCRIGGSMLSRSHRASDVVVADRSRDAERVRVTCRGGRCAFDNL
jgi:hypothetical protein